MVGQVELLMFAMRSAIRVNEQVRRGFADMVAAKELSLPLPNFPSAPSVESARSYYEAEGAKYLAAESKLRDLYNGWRSLTPEQTQVFLSRYQEHWALDEADAAPAGKVLQADLTWDDYRALLTVRQWGKSDKKGPSLLQRAAGTLIEIAVDYHLQMPGAVNPASANGKLVKAFLEAIDVIDFAEGDTAKIGTQLVDSLFSSVLQTLRDHPEIAADSKRGQELVSRVAAGVATKTRDLVTQAGNQLARDGLRDFAAALFPALLKSAAETVVGDPGKFLGLDKESEVALVSGVGAAILDATKAHQGLEGLFSQAALDAVTKAALTAAARYPELLGAKGERTGKLVAAVAGALGTDAARIGPGLLPELIRLTLEKSADNLDALLRVDPNDKTEKHLLVVALKQVLPVLASKPPNGAKWEPKFDAADALALAEALVDEVARNPQWLVDRAGQESRLLGDVVAAVLEALRMQAGPRLRRDTAVALVAAAVRAVGNRLELGTADAQGRRVVAVVAAAIVKTVHGDGAALEAAWLFARDEALQRLADLIFDQIAHAGARADLPQIVQGFLDETVDRIRKGESWTWQELAALLLKELEK